MSKNTKIEWTDHTFNPWEGCQKVGPGCDNCYAETRNARFAGGTPANWGPGAPRRRTSAGNWQQPIKWNKAAELAHSAWKGFKAQHPGLTDDELLSKGFTKPRRPRVFCASLADVFDNAVDPQWRADLFSLIQKTPYLDWLLLTKRIGNVVPMLEELCHGSDEHLSLLDMMPLPNVWIGATIVNQEEADRDIPKLLAIPARVRFLSMEPLLGPVSFEGIFASPRNPADGTNALEALDWVIVGGESGPGARPMHPDWARSLRDQCEAAGTAFLFKQWGEWVPRSSCYHRFADGQACADLDPSATRWPCTRLTYQGGNGNDLASESDGDDAYMQRTGKAMAGRLLDGRTWDEFPEPQ